MRTRDEERQQKHLLVRHLVRAGVRPQAISRQVMVSVRYVRETTQELRRHEALITEALREGQQTHTAVQT